MDLFFKIILVKKKKAHEKLKSNNQLIGGVGFGVGFGFGFAGVYLFGMIWDFGSVPTNK